MIVSWRLDGDDRLAGVGQDWAAFATANEGESCLPPPVGLRMEDFVRSPELLVVWKAVLQRARKLDGGRLELTYRCDAPATRRRLHAYAARVGPHEVEIVSQVVREQSRPPVPLLDHRITDRCDELIKMCSWCARIEAGDWVDIEEGCRRLGLLEEPRLPRITHTVCPGCMAAMSDELDSSPGFLPGNRRYFAANPG